MENQQHTPEPWDYDDEYNHAHIAGGEIVDMEPTGRYEVFADAGEVIICVASKPNARRIVACVNACAGIDTDQIELVNIAAMIDEVTRLRAENERLRDILKEATDATVSDYAHSIGFQDGSFPTGEPIKIDWLEWTKKSLAALSETAQP